MQRSGHVRERRHKLHTPTTGVYKLQHESLSEKRQKSRNIRVKVGKIIVFIPLSIFYHRRHTQGS